MGTISSVVRDGETLHPRSFRVDLLQYDESDDSELTDSNRSPINFEASTATIYEDIKYGLKIKGSAITILHVDV